MSPGFEGTQEISNPFQASQWSRACLLGARGLRPPEEGTLSPRWRYYFLGYLMALPHTLVGLFVFLVFYHARSWEWNQGVLTCVADGDVIWGHPMAQTQGWVQVFDSEASRNDAALRVHETCHVVQAFLLGPIYPILYGLTFLVAYARAGFPSKWYDSYMAIPFEEQAYAREAKYKAAAYPTWGA